MQFTRHWNIPISKISIFSIAVSQLCVSDVINNCVVTGGSTWSLDDVTLSSTLRHNSAPPLYHRCYSDTSLNPIWVAYHSLDVKSCGKVPQSKLHVSCGCCGKCWASRVLVAADGEVEWRHAILFKERGLRERCGNNLTLTETAKNENRDVKFTDQFKSAHARRPSYSYCPTWLSTSNCACSNWWLAVTNSWLGWF